MRTTWWTTSSDAGGGIALAALLSFAFVVTLAFPEIAPPQVTAATCTGSRLAPAAVVVGLADSSPTFEVTSPGCRTASWTLSWPAAGVMASSGLPAVSVPAAGLSNDQAGPTTATATVTMDDGSKVTSNVTVALKRHTCFGRLLVSPESGRASRRLILRATLGRVDWDAGTYRGYAGRIVHVLFRPADARSFSYFTSAVTGAGGRLAMTVPAGRPGAWRLEYPGDAASGAALSPPIRVPWS